MAKPAKPLAAKYAPTNNVLKSVACAATPKRPRSPKGKLILLARLQTRKFRQRLRVADPNGNVDELQRILIKALKRLHRKNIKSITASAWLGETFQIIVEEHPTISDLTKWAAGWYVRGINSRLGSGKTAIEFLDGRGRRVQVTKPFTEPVIIDNVRLRGPNQKEGLEFFDRGVLACNTDGQCLPIRMEIKTRGAGKELRKQLGSYTDRLEDSPGGTEMIYSIAGKSGEKSIDVNNLILVQGRQKRALEEDFFKQIGVIAGKTPIVREARDSSGRPYIRVKLPVDTDSIRSTIQRMLRDRSWQ